MELSNRSHDSETSRSGQLHLLAEQRDGEHVQQETLIRLSEEVEELRDVRFSEAKLCEEAYVEANSQHQEDNLEIKLQESWSTANKLTHQIKELQNQVNSLKGCQDFRDLETASSSGSTHAPDRQVVLPCFFRDARCASRDFSIHRICKVSQVAFLKIAGLELQAQQLWPQQRQQEGHEQQRFLPLPQEQKQSMGTERPVA